MCVCDGDLKTFQPICNNFPKISGKKLRIFVLSCVVLQIGGSELALNYTCRKYKTLAIGTSCSFPKSAASNLVDSCTKTTMNHLTPSQTQCVRMQRQSSETFITTKN